MARDNDIGDLMAFLAVARERSFTRAAAKRGCPSRRSATLDHVISLCLALQRVVEALRYRRPALGGPRSRNLLTNS